MEKAVVRSVDPRRLSAQGLLRVNDLTVSYRTRDGGKVNALEDVTFELEACEAVGLLGDSGCGKTTLARALLGVLPSAGIVVRGSVFFCGQNLIGLAENKLQKVRGAGIAMVYQEPGAALNPVLRIGDQITEVIRAHRRFSRERAREEAGFQLAKVGFPEESCVAAAYPHQLSGGQQQRVAIAQAIACRPALLIADEPTTALDRKTQLEILDLLTSLRKKNRLGLLLISHDFRVHAHAVDRILVLRDGQIVKDAKTREISDSFDDSYTQSLLSYSQAAVRRKNCSPSLVRKSNHSPVHTSRREVSHSFDAKHNDQPKLAEGFSDPPRGGERFDPSITQSGLPTGERKTLLFVSNLQKRYRQGRWLSAKRHPVQALYGIELNLDAGSTLAVVGPSGSGKSTLARCIACLERPDCGEIWFRGVDLASLEDRELARFRRQIQMIFQDPGSSLNPRFTALEIVSEPLLADGRMTNRECRDRALDLMAQVGLLPDWDNRRPHEFSAGQRRCLAIARALSLEPTLLILDEALAGLDRPMQAQIADLLLQLQARLSLTYVHISHDLDLVASLADRVAVLHQGQIVDAGNTRELFAHSCSVQAPNLVSATYELAGLRREPA